MAQDPQLINCTLQLFIKTGGAVDGSGGSQAYSVLMSVGFTLLGYFGVNTPLVTNATNVVKFKIMELISGGRQKVTH